MMRANAHASKIHALLLIANCHYLLLRVAFRGRRESSIYFILRLENQIKMCQIVFDFANLVFLSMADVKSIMFWAVFGIPMLLTGTMFYSWVVNSTLNLHINCRAS